MTLTLADIGVLFTIFSILLGIITGILVTVFQPKDNCSKCQSKCRSEIYTALDRVENKVNDRSELLTAVNAKLDLLIMGLNIKVGPRQKD